MVSKILLQLDFYLMYIEIYMFVQFRRVCRIIISFIIYIHIIKGKVFPLTQRIIQTYTNKKRRIRKNMKGTFMFYELFTCRCCQLFNGGRKFLEFPSNWNSL